MGLGRDQRIRCSADFRSVLRKGRRFDGRWFVLYVRPSSLSGARLGLAVGRRVGGAVERNRIKRLVRTAFRGVAVVLKPADLVVIPKAEIVGHGLREISDELKRRIESWQRGASAGTPRR